MMNFLSIGIPSPVRKILRREGKHAKVVILGTNGMGFALLNLPPEERGCEIIAVVDDFRAKEEKHYCNVPLITTQELAVLTKKHVGLIAINTCENPKPKYFFDHFCQENHIGCISFRQAEGIFTGLYNQKKLRVKKDRKSFYRQAGDWLIAHLGRWKFPDHKIALIRLDGAGDFILWLESARHIRNHYPEFKITLFANAHWAEYAETLPYWDAVIAINPSLLSQTLLYRWSIMLKIWIHQYDIVINPTFYRSYLETEGLVNASNAPHRIGWNCHPHPRLTQTEKIAADAWYTTLFTSLLPTPHVSEILRNAEFASLLIKKELPPAIHKLPKTTIPAIIPNLDYCILFPGASWSGRRWPIENFVALGEKLQLHFGWTIVLCGTKDEKPLCDFIQENISANVLNFAGKTSFIEFVELIRGAKMLVSNDTSAIHIAPAVDTASVCILGGGHYGMFLPYPAEINGIKPFAATKKMECYGCEWLCSFPRKIHEAVPCIRDITVDDVFNLVFKALDNETDISALEIVNITATSN
ncbi:glycosyltransferase family 9 protein [Methylobacillus pratensis]